MSLMHVEAWSDYLYFGYFTDTTGKNFFGVQLVVWTPEVVRLSKPQSFSQFLDGTKIF